MQDSEDTGYTCSFCTEVNKGSIKGSASSTDASGVNGLKNLKFTPKIAGSVIPINALSDDGNARDLIF